MRPQFDPATPFQQANEQDCPLSGRNDTKSYTKGVGTETVGRKAEFNYIVPGQHISCINDSTWDMNTRHPKGVYCSIHLQRCIKPSDLADRVDVTETTTILSECKQIYIAAPLSKSYTSSLTKISKLLTFPGHSGWMYRLVSKIAPQSYMPSGI